MDLTPTPEQDALRAAARAFLSDSLGAERVAELADSDVGWDAKIWPRLAELGWLGLSVPGDLGGSGTGLLEEAVVFEETAAALLAAPLFSTVALALPAVVASGDAGLVGAVVEGAKRLTFAWGERGGPVRIADAARSRVTATATATATASGFTLTGTKSWVPDLTWVDAVVVVGAYDDGPALFLVELDDAGVAVTPRSTIDTTRRLADLTLTGAEARMLVGGPAAFGVLETIRRRALVLAAAEAVGIAGRTLEISRDHASTRQQFGRVIGTYQAVSHQVADLYTAMELARSLLIWAAWTVDVADPAASRAVSAAASKAATVAVTASETAIQVLGGIGMTWDASVHRYYKRAMALEMLDGPPATHRADLADTLFVQPLANGPRRLS